MRKNVPVLTLSCSVILLLLMPLSALGVRYGLLAVKFGLLLLSVAVVINSLLGLFCLLKLSKPAHRGLYTLSLLSTVPALTLLAMGVNSLLNHPVIHQVSTDRQNPPAFVAALEQRGESSNPLAYTSDNASTQQLAYPDLESIHSGLTPAQAFQRAMDTARTMGWEIYAAERPEGRIEAVDTTFWFGFKDDIAIRIQALPEGGSLVDLRSISRIGGGDAGTNARRIRRFIEHFTQSTGQ